VDLRSLVARVAARRLLTCVAALSLVGGALVALATGRPVDGAPSCTVFPPDNPWNQRVDQLPVAANSGTLIGSMGARERLFPDFTIPFTTVGQGRRKVPVRFHYRRESDRGPYPIPRNAPIEEGSDRHVIVVDRDRCVLYELYGARRIAGGKRWRAGSGATWSLRSNRLRPRGWTSADAAGLPILPGLARYDEVAAGAIDHALRFTTGDPRDAYVYPARHSDGESHSRRLPPMGLRLRLRARFDVSRFPPQAQAILNGLKRYGMILADTGAPWFISGAPSPGWDDDELETLDRVVGSDFEVVDTRALPKPR
jgi:hypothetical protein